MQNVFLIALCFIGISACAVTADKTKQLPLLLSDHVLAGKIWDVRAQRFINQEQLIKQVLASEFLLLGETHDNSQHHRYQTAMIDALKVNKRSAEVAFEMISQQQGALIADGRYDSVESLLAALKHVPSNWQYEAHYIPLFESAIDAGFKIRAASLDKDDIRAIGNKGAEAIPAPIKTALDYNALTAEQEARLRKEIVGSHCGMDHEGMVSAMMLTQRVKDAVMMDSLLVTYDTVKKVDTKVLVAGSGHARNDWGVPKYILQAQPDAKVVSLAWLEVASEANAVADYAQRWGNGTLPFDYVWFTPRNDRPDPCEAFRKHMKKREASEAQKKISADPDSGSEQ